MERRHGTDDIDNARPPKPTRPRIVRPDAILLSVVCPCFNEADGITHFYSQLKRVLADLGADNEPASDRGSDHRSIAHEIILVDDGSHDETLSNLNRLAASDPAVRVYSLTHNMGHQVALSAGLEMATGDAVVMMDSDLQHPPELIPELLDHWRQGHDVVLAVRDQTADATWFKRVSSDGFYWLFNALSDVKLTPGAADFCLLSRRAHRALCEMPERRRFLRGMIAWMGYPTAQVHYEAPPRFAGQSKYSLKRMLKLALDATFSFSTRPIRVATKVGAACLLTAGVYLLYVVSRWMIVGDLVPGWASIVLAIVIMGGMQLMAIGMIGEYLAQIFEEVKGRPRYLLKQDSHTHRHGRVREENRTGMPNRTSVSIWELEQNQSASSPSTDDGDTKCA